jgi:hypothetical protein
MDNKTNQSVVSVDQNYNYEVERVVDRRVQYLLKSKEFSDKYNMWESEINIRQNCKRLTDEFEKCLESTSNNSEEKGKEAFFRSFELRRNGLKRALPKAMFVENLEQTVAQNVIPNESSQNVEVFDEENVKVKRERRSPKVCSITDCSHEKSKTFKPRASTNPPVSQSKELCKSVPQNTGSKKIAISETTDESSVSPKVENFKIAKKSTVRRSARKRNSSETEVLESADKLSRWQLLRSVNNELDQNCSAVKESLNEMKNIGSKDLNAIPVKVLGATNPKGKLKFYLELTNRSKKLVDSSLAYQLCPLLVIKYFESCIEWIN